jgi:type II secretory pathway pseudopilin PulG
MKWVRHQRFNLIEILIALGILSIGMVAVLGLFPVGFATTRDAMAESSSADSADQMLHMLQFKLKQKDSFGVYQNWIDMVGTTSGPGAGLPTAPAAEVPISIKDWNPALAATDAKWLLIEPFTAGCVIKSSTPGLYKIIRFVHTTPATVIPNVPSPGAANPASGEPYYYANEDILDFEAIAKVWKVPFTVDGTAAGNLGWDRAVVLNVEISWPANLEYAKRKKALYRLELFNGN